MKENNKKSQMLIKALIILLAIIVGTVSVFGAFLCVYMENKNYFYSDDVTPVLQIEFSDQTRYDFKSMLNKHFNGDDEIINKWTETDDYEVYFDTFNLASSGYQNLAISDHVFSYHISYSLEEIFYWSGIEIDGEYVSYEYFCKSLNVPESTVVTANVLVDTNFEHGNYEFLWQSTNFLFAQKSIILTLTIVALVMFLALLVCVCFPGMKSERKATFFDKIPIDFTVVFFIFAFAIGIAFISDQIYYLDLNYDIFGFIEVAIASFIITLLVVSCVAYIARRVKLKRIYKGSILCYAVGFVKKHYKKVVDFAKLSYQNANILWQVVLVFLGYGVIALVVFTILFGYISFPVKFWLWLVMMILFAPIVAMLVINMNGFYDGIKKLASGDLESRVETKHMKFKFKESAENLNAVSGVVESAVGEALKSERMKTELITNVSHDLKTPLTSIINYSDLIVKADGKTEEIAEYSEVLHRQSTRMKTLIEDLIEASKVSTGNVETNLEKCDLAIMIEQILGEYDSKMNDVGLQVVNNTAESEILANVDIRHTQRVLDNIISNALKYSMAGTRIYVSSAKDENGLYITVKNISQVPLDCSGEELVSRFWRGDKSRNTEGNGLGLSIAKSLMEIQNGELNICVDGDMFCAVLKFPVE
ncbi:MAG: HAMP domain-containing sensor histidine kinase [Bacillota bacterium]